MVSDDTDRLDRRTVIGAVGGLTGFGLLAGCIGEEDDPVEEADDDPATDPGDDPDDADDADDDAEQVDYRSNFQ